MSKKLFTDAEIEILLSNPYTLKVNRVMIVYTDEFKQQYKRRLLLGHVSTRIFKDLGYDLQMLGLKRIYSFDTRMKELMKLETELKECDNQPVIVDPEAELAKLQNEVIYLRQEMEFVKKILQAANSRK